MSASSPGAEQILSLLRERGLITIEQSGRVQEALGMGMALQDAINVTPLVEPSVLTELLAKPSTIVATAPSPAPTKLDETDTLPLPGVAVVAAPAPVAAAPSNDDDVTPMPEIPQPKGVVQKSETGPAKVTVDAEHDPKRLLQEKIQEPATKKSEVQSMETIDGFEIDDDFDFGDHDDHSAPATQNFGAGAASPAVLDDELDLGDEFMLPDAEPTTKRVSNEETGMLTEAISSIFDDVFEDSGAETPGQADTHFPQTAPAKLNLPANVSIYLKATSKPDTHDLNTHSSNVHETNTNQLLGESVVLGHRGIILFPTNRNQNVALYDPKGSLEETKSFPKESVGGIVRRLQAMSKASEQMDGTMLGQCFVEFEDEKRRALVELLDSGRSTERMIVYLVD